MEFISETTVLC